jgi:hypothetical protein
MLLADLGTTPRVADSREAFLEATPCEKSLDTLGATRRSGPERSSKRTSYGTDIAVEVVLERLVERWLRDSSPPAAIFRLVSG